MITRPCRGMLAIPGALLLMVAPLLSGCGKSSVEESNDRLKDSGTAVEVSGAIADLSGFCVKQLLDGSGDEFEAGQAVDRLITAARDNPEFVYQTDESVIGDTTFPAETRTIRQVMIDEASDLEDCGAQDLAGKIDRELGNRNG